LYKLKVSFIISLLAVSVGIINFGNTTASENNEILKRKISKDLKPNAVQVFQNELGTMTASWYGPRFDGKITANGEIYNQMALTAAHKSLPFGTILHVTNLNNGKSIYIRINDRGPYIEGRDLDLSKGTALALGMLEKGVIRVNVKELILETNSSPISTLN
jgi:rare lipoprotein A